MTDPIVQAVAKAIQDADTDIHVAYDVLARAAIQAYEAAKREDLSDSYTVTVPNEGDWVICWKNLGDPDKARVTMQKVEP